MAWKNQGGGPWGGGGNDGRGAGPGPGGPTPPDIEEMLKRGQDKIKQAMPGGLGGKGIILLAMVAVLFWASSGFYRVQPGEQGVELLFGKFVKLTGPGLHVWLPSPMGEVQMPNVERTNTISIGFRGAGEVGRGMEGRDVAEESHMLTGDQNILDIDFVVQWRIKNAAEYLFNIRNPESTVKIAAESALREVIGQTTLEDAMTSGRQKVQVESKDLLQKILDSYKAGIFIAEIQLQKSDPPPEVIDAFNDVQRAKQDQERKINEANAYKNDMIPRAHGAAQKLIQEATAYKERLTKEADGEAKRFIAVYDSFRLAKDVTTQRIFLERMQEVLSKSEKVIIDSGSGGQGVVPYLPLPELRKRVEGASQ